MSTLGEWKFMSSYLTNIKEKTEGFFDKIKNNKILRITLIAILAIIIVFIAFGVNKKQTGQESAYSASAVDEYVSNLENKLTKTLSKVEGAGDVSVIITVESGMETVLATKTTVTETSNGKETIETPIIVNGKTVVLKEMYPKIVGVLIVAKGASNISVLNKLQQATISLLDININQIEILTMK